MENSTIMIKEKAMKHRTQLSVNTDGIPETIKADELKVKQIMYNLLSNAVKFTPDGGKISLTANRVSSSELRAVTSGHEDPIPGRDYSQCTPANTQHPIVEFVQISVEDTGIGIKKKNLKRIFNPFEQADGSSSRSYQGTGLGLSLTKNFVELHGGKIWAESEGEGKGSAFRFIIPI